AGDAGDVMNTGRSETHRPDSCLASFRLLALLRAGAGRAALATVAALVFLWMRWNVFRIGLSGAGAGIAVALLRRGLRSLFLILSGCHNFSNRYPSLKQRTCR